VVRPAAASRSATEGTRVFEILREYGPMLAEYAVNTVTMSVLAFASAIAVGAVIAGFRLSPVPPLRRLATIYTEAFRNIPLAVLMIVLFFVLPDLDLRLSGYWTGWLALTLYSGAYAAEVIRAGVNTVATGEVEAARAIGLGFTRVLGLIVLPQAVRTVVPPFGSLFIAHTKNTTVAALISAGELADFVRRVGSATANTFDTALVVAVLFVLVLVPVGALFGVLERRVEVKR
jgi:glutamate transport system permease protein